MPLNKNVKLMNSQFDKMMQGMKKWERLLEVNEFISLFVTNKAFKFQWKIFYWRKNTEIAFLTI
jgi:hypothetical protein